jgi:hypothetical protein
VIGQSPWLKQRKSRSYLLTHGFVEDGGMLEVTLKYNQLKWKTNKRRQPSI